MDQPLSQAGSKKGAASLRGTKGDAGHTVPQTASIKAHPTSTRPPSPLRTFPPQGWRTHKKPILFAANYNTLSCQGSSVWYLYLRHYIERTRSRKGHVMHLSGYTSMLANRSGRSLVSESMPAVAKRRSSTALLTVQTPSLKPC